MNSNFISEYLKIQHESFEGHVKSVLKALDAFLKLSEESQMSDQQKSVVRKIKLLYEGYLVEHVANDLRAGIFSEETIDNRLRLEEEACHSLIEMFNPNPQGRIILDFLLSEHISAMRCNLKYQAAILEAMKHDASEHAIYQCSSGYPAK